jgi:hypothetical protein
MLSERIPLWRGPLVVVVVPLTIAALLGVVVVAVQPVIEATISYSLPARCLVVLAFTAPVSLLLGCCFPLGMRLLGRVSETLSPWMWGVNGACSVLASALAVGVSMWVGIDASLMLAALLYLALIGPALSLLKAGAAVEAPSVAVAASSPQETLQTV